MQVVDKTVEDPQVHPTDVVKPDDPDAKLKFLVKEVLHGVGLFSMRTETVLPMNWEDGTACRERCGRTNLHSTSL